MVSPVKFSLRNKLFVFVIVAFSLQLLMIVWQIRQQALKVSDESINSSLSQSTVILNTKLESRFYSIREVANSISKDGRVLPLVFDKDSPTLQDLSLEFQKVLEFNSLFFIDDEGLILARSDRPEAIGRSLLGKSQLFDQAINGTTTQGYIVSRGDILQIVVEPIFDNVAGDIVRGLVAVAYRLSPQIANDIHKLTASDVGFFAYSRNKAREVDGVDITHITDEAIRETLQAHIGENPEAWQAISGKENEISTLSLGDTTYYTVLKEVNSYDGSPLGLIMTFRSRTDLMKPFMDMERSVIIIGIISLIISIILSMIIAYRMTKPIFKLVTITGDIEQGHYSSKVIHHGTPADEIELLSNSVIKMGNSIREKNELETFLAGLATNFDDSFADSATLAQSSDISNPQTVRANTYKDKAQSDDEDITTITPITFDKPNETNLSKEYKDKHRRAIDQITVGDLVDERYELINLLGKGFFGCVFLAEDKELNEKIAIKVMDVNRLNHIKTGLSYHQEIKLARKISHRNITRTYDFGSFDHFLYITMEYVDGYTLEGLISQSGPINNYLGLILSKQMCLAVHAAHEQGIIHRDLKPQNISINQQGVIKIMDFGLAFSLRSISKEQREQIRSTAAGTPKFMAPEQFYGLDIDTRTDIYALGILMFYIFTGNVPYNTKGFEAMAELHRTADIPMVNSINPEVSKTLSQIIAKAMGKTPEDRYQSVRELIDDLNKVSAS